MSDERAADVPEDAGDSGAQGALGERRRRRLAERAGQVDLDTTMSDWPVADPPSGPRPVVRPARPTLDGVATAPVLPPPGQLVVGPLVEARRSGTVTGSSAPPAGGRRSHRRAETAPGDPVATDIVPRDQPAAQDAVPDRSSAQAGPDPAAGSRGAAELLVPFPTPIRSGERGHDDTGAQGAGGLRGLLGSGLSWPPGRREVVLAAVVLAVVLLVVVLLVQRLGGDDGAEAVQQTTGSPAQQTPARTLADPDASTEPTPGDLP